MTAHQLIQRKGFFDEIVKLLHEETGQHVNIMGPGGVILSSTKPERIGTVHEAAQKIMKGTIDEAHVTEEQAAQLSGVRAGSNVPIEYNGERIAVIGMTGDPSAMHQIVRVAVRTVELWIKNHEEILVKEQAALEVNEQLQNIAAAIQEISAKSQEFASSSKAAMREVLDGGEKIKNISQVLKVIKELAAQSNLIGLNAAIEAARAGEAGRSFGVVAGEVRKLANTSERSVGEIQTILHDIHQTFNKILEQAQLNDRMAEEQSNALQDLIKHVEKIESMMDTLNQK